MNMPPFPIIDAGYAPNQVVCSFCYYVANRPCVLSDILFKVVVWLASIIWGQYSYVHIKVVLYLSLHKIV